MQQDFTSLPVLPHSPEGDGEGNEPSSGLTIPPQLQRYVSLDLWRRLNGANPPRGLLINALARVRSVLNQLSTFLPGHLVQEKLRRPLSGLASGQMLSGTLLYADVSGFTALSERLAESGPQGAELLTEIMNRYFARMIEIISWSGGTLLKFAGDATLVYFPEQPNQAQAGWAVRAGQRMLRAVSVFSDDLEDMETIPDSVWLQMNIGAASGAFLAASVGGAKRMEYVVFGPAVAHTLTAESISTAAGQLVIDAATRAALGSSADVSDFQAGFGLVGPASEKDLDDFEIRPEPRRPRWAIPKSTSPHALLAQAEVAIRQIEAILPYLPQEVVEQVLRGQRAQLPGQYRPTTVIFCNFWGYETLLAEWGAAGVQRITSILNDFFTTINDIVTRYGGIISRIDPYSQGSKLLILFGAPVAHEDDPQRAINATLAMNAELENLNETWRSKFARHLPPGQSGPLLQHRIGITTGTTFAGQVGSPARREYTVMGDSVNLSARLMAAADPGQILVSLPTDVQEVVTDYFHLTPLPPIRVKGKSKPISIFQVQSQREDLLVARAHKHGQLIGRRQELERCDAALQAAFRGECRLLVLSGPAGIGKSHLSDELLQRARQRGAQVVFYSCRSYGAAEPFSSWVGLLRSLAGISNGETLLEVHRNRLRQMSQRLNLPKRVTQSLASLMDLNAAQPAAGKQADQGSDREPAGSKLASVLDQQGLGKGADTEQTRHDINSQPGERETMYEAVLDLLGSLTRTAPLVIFFEDAHWMDSQSRDLVQFVMQRAAHLPLLFLLAQRGDPQPDEAEPGQVINMAPLSPQETTELVAHLLVSDLAPVIHEQSGGNPLFVEEITRWLRGTHIIEAGQLRSVLQSSNVLQQLVLSELENLPEEQRDVAFTASVIGYAFRTGELQTLLPEIDPVTLGLHLRGLARARLIILVEAGADAGYAFQQSLVRDVLYQSLPYERRKSLHTRIAEYLSQPSEKSRVLLAHMSAAMQASPAERLLPSAEVVAGHYELAESWLAAMRTLAQAGDTALAQGAFARASACFSRALADLEKAPVEYDPGERAAQKLLLLTGLGDAALCAGDFLAAATAYESAAAAAPLAAMLAEAPALAAPLALAYRLALALPHLQRAEEAETRLRSALQAAAESPSPEALIALAWLAARSGRADAKDCIAAARNALPTAAQDDPSWARRAGAFLNELAGEWETAFHAYLDDKLFVEAGWLALSAGDAAVTGGNLPDAEMWWRRALEHPVDGGEAALLRAAAAYRQAEVAYRAGRLEAARAALETASAFLADAPPVFALEGQRAIQQAGKCLTARIRRSWPAWRSQPFEDLLRTRLIFRPRMAVS